MGLAGTERASKVGMIILLIHSEANKLTIETPNSYPQSFHEKERLCGIQGFMHMRPLLPMNFTREHPLG